MMNNPHDQNRILINAVEYPVAAINIEVGYNLGIRDY